MTVDVQALIASASKKVTGLHPGSYLVHGRFGNLDKDQYFFAKLCFYDSKINSFWGIGYEPGGTFSDIHAEASPGSDVSLTPISVNIGLDSVESVVSTHGLSTLRQKLCLYTPLDEGITESMWIVECFDAYAVGATSSQFYVMKRSWAVDAKAN